MYFIAKLGAVGAVGFASTTGASAQAMEAATRGSDFLLMAEAPMTASELQEARGGFSFGGFDFDFGIEIAPIQPIPEGGLFGNDGVFGGDGVFGPGGVFGENGNPGNQAAGGNSPQQQVQPTVAAPQVNTPAVNNAPSPSPVVNNAPSPSPVVNNAPSPSPVVNNAPAPSPVVNNAPAPSSVVNNTPAAPQSPAPAPQNVAQSPNSPAPNNPANAGGAPQAVAPSAGGGNAQKSGGGSGPSMSFGGTAQNIISRVTQTIGADGRTVVIDNNMNGVRLQQTIDFNVRVLNFDARINRAIADSVTATLASRNLILNAATNN